MRLTDYRHIAVLLTVVTALTIAGCGTQKNTAQSRWWQSFTARYNTYYNGSMAYIDGSLEKEQGNKDNFTELIPLYTVGNKGSRELGLSNFQRAIEKSEKAIHQHSIKRRPEWTKSRRKTAKDIEWLNRREYNPFLWKAWLLMGRAQFHSGAFDEAASTFAYMSRLYATQPAIYGRARAWLAKCYIEQGWMYDAEDVIRNMQRDSIHWAAQKEWDYTYADYYIHSGDFRKAIPYLRKVIRHEMRRKQRAREWYLMGQLYAAIGNRQEAYKSFRRVVRLSPPYELDFNARIAMSEVMAGSQSKKMIAKLKRMAANDNNKEYLDQVYYAIGNIYLAQKDTANAIGAYEQGSRKATRNGVEKGVLLLHLGDLYWNREKFSDARRCYGEAIGLLDKDRKDYAVLSQRSKVLDELVPHTEAVELQDSLQALVKMNEKDRNAAIDRIIAALKKKEKEERAAQAEAESNRTQQQNSGAMRPNLPNVTSPNATTSTTWYFYNPTAVSQGKSVFQRQWGKRENVDNWQRSNRTVVMDVSGAENMTDAMRDSLVRAAEMKDSLAQIADSAHNDPHRREYYLAQIPFTPEQMEASNKILEDGLYNSGVIFKDQLDKLRLSEKALRRLVDNYPDFEHLDDAYYHLFLLYSRMGMPTVAESYINKLKRGYPKSRWTALLTDPYFKENARFGVHIEDSLYAATYAAFKADRYHEVKSNMRLSEERFPMGANRDKFLFIGGLSKLNNGDATGCVDNMRRVVESYPNSRISEMAGMIVNGVNAGRHLRGGKFDLGDVWNRRSIVLNDSDSIAKQVFSTDRNADFVFMVVYTPDSLNENRLLFELAKFNFTTYLVRNFDIDIEDVDGLHRMAVSGFRNYDEALQYAHQLYQQSGIAKLLGNSRSIIISRPNIDLLGTRFSYDDYAKFYSKHFTPLKVSTFRLLTEPAEIATKKESETEPTPEEIDRTLDEDGFIDNGLDILPEQNNVPPTHTGTLIIPEEKTPTPVDKGTIIIPEAPLAKPSQPATPVKPATLPAKPTGTGSKQTTPIGKPNATGKTPAVPKPAPTPKQSPKPQPKKEDTGVYFDDGFGGTFTGGKNTGKSGKNDRNKPEKKKQTFDLEDEYYELDGF